MPHISVLVGGVAGVCFYILWTKHLVKRFVVDLRKHICTCARNMPVKVLSPGDLYGCASKADLKLWITLSDEYVDGCKLYINELISRNSTHSINYSLSYVFGAYGKLVRSRLFYILSRAVNIPADRNISVALELEHTASLLHDDVVDKSAIRRGRSSHCAIFGNGLSIAHGDYLINMLVSLLADVNIPSITLSFARSMEDLVRGELMQVDDVNLLNADSLNECARLLNSYLEKCFCKTATLFVVCCNAVAVEANLGSSKTAALNELGLCLGMCFQLIDDILDFGSNPESQKPADGFDLCNGLATGPVIFACEQHPVQLLPMIARKFSGRDDPARALHLVRNSDGLLKTRILAETFAQKARELLQSEIGQSVYRSGLESLIDAILSRDS